MSRGLKPHDKDQFHRTSPGKLLNEQKANSKHNKLAVKGNLISTLATLVTMFSFHQKIMENTKTKKAHIQKKKKQ